MASVRSLRFSIRAAVGNAYEKSRKPRSKEVMQIMTQSGWQIFEKGPEAYERYIVPAWMGAWAEDLVSAGKVIPGKRVLDVACGTGIVARKAALKIGTNGSITGIDVNDGMIQAARSFAARDGILSIEWLQGNALCMPFDEGGFDIVLCQQGLQFSPDPLAAVKEMYRVLAPGGTVAVSMWRAFEKIPCFKAFAHTLEGFFGEEASDPFHASCSLGDGRVIKKLMDAGGFRKVHMRLEVKVARHPSPDAFIVGYLAATPLAGQVSNMHAHDRLELFRQIKQSLRDYIDDDGLAAPMECHVITARK